MNLTKAQVAVLKRVAAGELLSARNGLTIARLTRRDLIISTGEVVEGHTVWQLTEKGQAALND